MSRVLVIKPGYRQGLPGVLSLDVSLSSVLRSTVVLNLFEEDEVTWVTTSEAAVLVNGAANVRRVLVYDSPVALALSYETFDTVVNLEPSWEFCALAESVNARLRYGFTLDAGGREVTALPGAERAQALSLSRTARRKESRPHQQALYELMGKDWQGERLVLGYRPTTGETFDVGFNTSAGHPRRNKIWPETHWRNLEQLLLGRYAVIYEPSSGDLPAYMDWLNRCRIVVTADTLGLTLALALGKKVVALFGPTSAERCHTYGRGIKLTPSVKLNCIPCCDTECPYGKSCIETISPADVAQAIDVLNHIDVLEN